MSLQRALRAGAKIQDIAAQLDELDPTTRLSQMQALTPRDQRVLYERAADAPPLSLEFFVPEKAGRLNPVIHHGKNSTPVFRDFQKRMCRPKAGMDELYGYNETPLRRLMGPGYFVAHVTEADGLDPRGAVAIDYLMLPDSDVAPGWPAVKEARGLARIPYAHSRDYMRRVSQHISVGAAVLREKFEIGYFVLCREASR